jgi:hypothetical protein
MAAKDLLRHGPTDRHEEKRMLGLFLMERSEVTSGGRRFSAALRPPWWCRRVP